jgi:hypothetical protein
MLFGECDGEFIGRRRRRGLGGGNTQCERKDPKDWVDDGSVERADSMDQWNDGNWGGGLVEGGVDGI